MALTDTQLQNDAIALLDNLQSSGCTNGFDASVQTFQQSYVNAGGSLPADSGGASPIDGLYGANTQAALQAVIDANQGNSSLGGKSAPAGCVGAGGGGGGGGGNTLPPVVVTGSSSSGSGALPYIIGAVVIAGALAAYTYSHKKKRR